MDAPEKKQAFGRHSKSYTSELALGLDVRVKVKTRDRYRRIVAEVVLPDGRVLDEEIVKAGMAWVFIKYCQDDAYLKLEVEARRRGIGLWSVADPMAPWEFRKKRAPGMRTTLSP